MFTYTTLFLGSFIVALVALFVLKVVVDTRKASRKAKERVDLVKRAPTHQYEGAARAASAGVQFPPDDAGQGMAWRSAKTTPAMADEHSVFQSHGSGVSTPDQPMVQDRSTRKARGCSLYDAGPVETNVVNEPAGKSYKVTHHGPFDNLDD